MGDRGDHLFKFPNYALAARLVQWFTASDTSGAAGVLYNGAMVAAFWSHRGYALEARIGIRMTDTEIDEAAELCIDELQDAGYAPREISKMAAECDQRLAEWLRDQTEATEAAEGFSPAPS